MSSFNQEFHSYFNNPADTQGFHSALLSVVCSLSNSNMTTVPS